MFNAFETKILKTDGKKLDIYKTCRSCNYKGYSEKDPLKHKEIKCRILKKRTSMQSMRIMWKYESISANYLTNIYIHTHISNYVYSPCEGKLWQT